MTGNDTHADTIREALQRDPEHLTYSRDAHMALDALVTEVERERARADRAEAILARLQAAEADYFCDECYADSPDEHTHDCSRRAALSAGSGGRETT